MYPILKTERDIYSAGKSVDYLFKLANLERQSLIDHGMLEQFVRDPNRRMSAAAFLTSASVNLSERQRLGLLMYNSFIVSIDDLLDKDLNNIFQDPDGLKRFILSSQMPTTDITLTGSELYGKTLSCFPEEKQLILTNFFEEMLELHLDGDNHGEPGKYGFDEAREYKARTNIPFFRTGLVLGDSPIADENIGPMIMGLQYFEDAIDWREDMRHDTKNMLVGMANDMWIHRGQPNWQDIDLMFEMQTADPQRLILAEPNMQNTRTAYKKAFFNEFKGEKNVPLARTVKLAGRLAL